LKSISLAEGHKIYALREPDQMKNVFLLILMRKVLSHEIYL